MNIFVATRETQGQRDNDFCYADEDEIVAFSVLVCTGETADGECGCARSLEGLRTHKATTTMKVVEYDGNLRDLGCLIFQSLQNGGWFESRFDQFIDRSMAKKIAQAASKFPIGTVVEYRDGQFAARQLQIESVN